jgi:endonuclease/exonuclease/phosphatase family metal-dependent hydrolase
MAGGAIESKTKGDSALRHLFEPIVFNRPERTIPAPLRVTLLNACGGIHMERIARCLSQPPLDRSSIILLCESDWGTRRTGRLEIASELAKRLQMSFAYIPEFGIPVGNGTHGSFLGNAILTTMPLEEVRAVAMPLPRPSEASPVLRARMGLPAGLVAKVRSGGREVSIGVAHLSSHCSPAARDEQMAFYLAGLPASGPAIVGGDLNTTTTELATTSAMLRTFARMAVNPWRFRAPQSYEPLFKRMAAAGLRIDGVNAMGKPTFTFGRVIPPIFRPKLDWLAVRDLEPVQGSAAVIQARPSFLSLRVSDHDFVTAEVRI